MVGAQLGLKAKKVLKGQRSRKAHYVDSLPRPGKFFDLQWLLRHGKDVNGE